MDIRTVAFNSGRFSAAACLFVATALGTGGCESTPSVPPDTKKPPVEDEPHCTSHEPLRQPFFGDTHIHTSYSFDAYVFSVRNDPNDAYRFAKGAALPLPAAFAKGGTPQTRTTQLKRPLDFAAVTDHAELFGEMQICTQSPPGTPGRDAIVCEQMRTSEPDATIIAGVWALNPLAREETAKPLGFCNDEGVSCDSISMWQSVQDAAELHYDKSSACSFTTFVAYEFTGQPSWDNLHRNVIFKNGKTVARPITNVTIDGSTHMPELWRLLDEECVNAGTGCDVLTIPHNANISGRTETAPDGRLYATPANLEEARQRAFFEPLTEIIQHKGASECRYDRLSGRGVQTTDEFCTFEQLPVENLAPDPATPAIHEFPTRNVIRNALKDGMVLAKQFQGLNPFKYGIVGSTDDHNGTPGNTNESDFPGHAGTKDAPLAYLIDGVYRGPGGLAVVWAEENTRDSLFSAMRRKEVYGTSGTRPIVRFFGGWSFDTTEGALCNDVKRVATGYAQGVPMGSDLPPRTGASAPRFLVAALKDTGTPSSPGTPLQRIQIVKGWVDAKGETQEKVVTVVGESSTKGDELNTETCERNQSAGYTELCTVWEDPEFDATQPAFYYARVLENPSCRWSTYACRQAGVDPFLPAETCRENAAVANQKSIAAGVTPEGQEPFHRCCLNETNDPFVARTMQERAWTSPIWYEPTP